MNFAVWQFLGILSLLTTGGTLVLAGTERVSGLGEEIGGALGMVLWGVWAFGATDLTKLSNGTAVDVSEPTLALIGGLLALIHTLIMLIGTMGLLNVLRRGEEPV